MKTIMYAVKFRRGVKKLPPFETPDVFPVLELIESLERLNNMLMEAGNENGKGSERRIDNDANTASCGLFN